MNSKMTAEVVRNHRFCFKMAEKFRDEFVSDPPLEVLQGPKENTSALKPVVVGQIFDSLISLI